MRKLFFTFFCVAGCLITSAQTQTDESSITVVEDPEIQQLMNAYKAINKAAKTEKGYRIHILFSNDRAEIFREKAKLYKNNSKLKSYIEFESPYYRLRAGDYKTRLDASKALNRLMMESGGDYRSAYVVKDEINMK